MDKELQGILAARNLDFRLAVSGTDAIRARSCNVESWSDSSCGEVLLDSLLREVCER